MTNNISFMQGKLVPIDAIRGFSAGSHEHLSLRLDDVISQNSKMFVGEGRAARIATFPSHVFVGTDDGQYYRVQYEDVNGQISLGQPERLDVPVIDKGGLPSFINNYSLGVVDAILSSTKEEAKEKILDLVALQEMADDASNVDLFTKISGLLRADRTWRGIYKAQFEGIRQQIGDMLESISAHKAEPRYVSLYDGTVPETKFASYRDSVVSDLSGVAVRLEQVAGKTEATYLPFVESIFGVSRTAEEDKVVGQFTAFASDFLEDLQVIRDHVAFALKNEGCVMCLGQIYDVMAESLTDYEVAGTFIERMAGRFNEAA